MVYLLILSSMSLNLSFIFFISVSIFLIFWIYPFDKSSNSLILSSAVPNLLFKPSFKILISTILFFLISRIYFFLIYPILIIFLYAFICKSTLFYSLTFLVCMCVLYSEFVTLKFLFIHLFDVLDLHCCMQAFL